MVQLVSGGFPGGIWCLDSLHIFNAFAAFVSESRSLHPVPDFYPPDLRLLPSPRNLSFFSIRTLLLPPLSVSHLCVLFLVQDHLHLRVMSRWCCLGLHLCSLLVHMQHTWPLNLFSRCQGNEQWSEEAIRAVVEERTPTCVMATSVIDH